MYLPSVWTDLTPRRDLREYKETRIGWNSDVESQCAAVSRQWCGTLYGSYYNLLQFVQITNRYLWCVFLLLDIIKGANIEQNAARYCANVIIYQLSYNYPCMIYIWHLVNTPITNKHRVYSTRRVSRRKIQMKTQRKSNSHRPSPRSSFVTETSVLPFLNSRWLIRAKLIFSVVSL